MQALSATQQLACGPRRVAAFTGARRSAQQHARRIALVVRAEERVTTEAEAELPQRSLDFGSDKVLTGRGFTAQDSAGQTNIFAVEPKTYVQGSSNDNTDSAAALSSAVLAGAAALSGITLGLGAVLQQPSESLADYDPSAYPTLTQLSATFKGELTSVSAPALTE